MHPLTPDLLFTTAQPSCQPPYSFSRVSEPDAVPEAASSRTFDTYSKVDVDTWARGDQGVPGHALTCWRSACWRPVQPTCARRSRCFSAFHHVLHRAHGRRPIRLVRLLSVSLLLHQTLNLSSRQSIPRSRRVFHQLQPALANPSSPALLEGLDTFLLCPDGL